MPPVVRAHFDGECARCREDIDRGDLIKADPRTGLWVHADCEKEEYR